MGLFDLFKKKSNPAPVSEPAPVPAPAPEPEPAPVQEEPKPAYNTYDFKVAGTSFREKDIINNLMFENEDYSMSKKDLIDAGMTDERIFKYDWDFMKVELIPDPTNEHDPNAIKVMIDDTHVGFVPANKTGRVKKILDKSHIIALACAIYGGPYKIITEDYDDEKDKSTYTIEKDTVNIGIKISITYE